MADISRRLPLLAAGLAIVFALVGGSGAVLASDVPAQARSFIEKSAARARAEAPAAKAAGETRARFASLFAQTFDIDGLVKGVIGGRWASLSGVQQNEFRSAFQAYVVKAYADRFYAYAGQPMSIVATEAAPNGGVIVRTRVQMPDGAAQVPVDWQVSQGADGSRITDVVIDGVSLTRTQRDEFASVIRANGGDVTKLTAMLNERSR